MLSRVIDMTADLATRGGGSVESVGVGIAGFVDRAGKLWYSPNIPGVVDFPLRVLLREALGVRVVVENDATAATWAEARLGAVRGSDHVGLVALGTGIGSGFVLDGLLQRGWLGFSGEAGHMVVEMTGEKHLTGARGPWEMYASGSGLGVMTRAAAAQGRLRSVLEAVGSVDEINGEHLEPAVDAGDPEALAVLDDFGRMVAVGVANLVHILDLEVVVIGGGLVGLGPPLIEAIQRWTDEFVLGGELRPRPRIVAAELGAAAGALGAALIARESD
jgi:glucokinase